MSSLVPNRRVGRATRTTTAKDSENANARPSRISSRAKPLSNNPLQPNIATTAKAAKASTTDLKADQPVGKRKREALGEVTALVNRTTTNGVAIKGGKGKESSTTKRFDGVVINKAKSSTTASVIRQPLRTVAGTRQSAKGVVPSIKERSNIVPLRDIAEQQEQPAAHDENAMIIDPPVHNPLPAIAIRKSLVSEEELPPAAGGSRRSSSRRTLSSRPFNRAEEADETGRVFKKRRTSSEAPEEDPEVEQARLQAEEDALEFQAAAELGGPEEFLEADPEGEHWDDLDADDADDPLMVSEYVVEIFNYLREVELTTMPNPNYMQNQKELAWSMRGILADWLIELHYKMRLLPETLFLCMNIIDRFLSARIVSLAKLQLVGVTSMFIAAKVEEIMAPSAQHFVEEADGVYTEADMFQAERYVLKTLDWNLSYPNPLHYLRRISKADQYNIQARVMAKYLLEIACVEWRLIAAPPSVTAAAAMWLARLMLGNEQWDANLAHYSSYAENSLLPTANLMLNYLLKPMRHETFYRKYASKKYFKVATFAKAWTRHQWDEGTQVNLQKELRRLKVEARAARIEAELREEGDAEGEEEEIRETVTTARSRSRR